MSRATRPPRQRRRGRAQGGAALASPLPGSRGLPRFFPASIVGLLLAAALACSLPGLARRGTGTPTPTRAGAPEAAELPAAAPSPTPLPAPPALVESDPPPGSELPLQGPLTLYFNQAMNRASVEEAIAGLAARFRWEDDATLILTPREPLAPGEPVGLTVNASARAANGLPLPAAIHLDFPAAGYLRLAQQLPEAEARSVDPSSAVVATFNRPVVSLGASPEDLPPAFSLSPSAEGRGEWLNTSTYAFYPQPALAGGTRYTVRLNPQLAGTDGNPLEEAVEWSFTTALPRLLSIEPASGSSDVRLDANVVLTFNQPMDSASVEENFALLDEQRNPLPGEFTWNEDLTALTFNPAGLLKRAQQYTILLGRQASGLGGTPLETDFRATLETVPALEVVSSEPGQNGTRDVYGSVVVSFNAPIQPKNVLQFVTFSPEVSNLNFFLDDGDRTLRLFGDFEPQTEYSLIVSPNLPDAWNGRLGHEFSLDFRTLPLEPALYVAQGSEVLFLTRQDSRLSVQATNLASLSYSLGPLSLEDFHTLVGIGGYERRQSYQPESSVQVEQDLDLPANRSVAVDVPLSLGGEPLATGLYFLRFDRPNERLFAGPYLLVVSDVHLALKLSATEALAWAVDLRDGSLVANAPLTLYAEDGQPLASGRTGADGVFRASIPARSDLYQTHYAVLGEPGEDAFAMALTDWSQGLEGGFDIPLRFDPPQLRAYLYTDRPVYRPGQTVYFRAVARQAYNGRYSLPERSSLSLRLVSEVGEPIATFDLPLSDFGTAHGSYALPAEMAPGVYRLESEEAGFSGVSFRVAEYRKPEIDLAVSFESGQALAGEPLAATVEARYFFDAPAGNLPVRWSLFRQPSFFHLPGYEVGPQDTSWLDPFPGTSFFTFGELVSEGQGETNAQGVLNLEFPSRPEETRQTYTLEVTAQDESGLPVSARATVQVNPAEFYIGVRPDAWVGRAGEEAGFEVLVVDWEGHPAGERPLRAEFSEVAWERQEARPGDPFGFPRFIPRYTPVASTDFAAGLDGLARLAFTPPQAGTYQLQVSSLDEQAPGAMTQALLWVAGEGRASWPNLPNQRLRLTPDKEAYRPGESAQVFIPNPFGRPVQALVTMERGVVLRHQVVVVEGSGSSLSLPLGEEDAPNVYVSVTLLKAGEGEAPDFRLGYLNLPVEPVGQRLQVELTGEPQKTAPGGVVTVGLRVRDAEGRPVQGEFSLAVVDEAVLALADPNSEDILPAFYGNQPLGVRTGLALAAYTYRQVVPPGGQGGGGGDFLPPIVVRELFPDTAFWEPGILTDESGEARLTITLPDNLTTWRLDLRGLTADTRVGQASLQVVTTKDLLIRPITPRFLVLGDHARLAAVVQNNTGRELEVEVSLQAMGFDLDDPALAAQRVSLPAGGRARLDWWGTVQDVESVDAIFSASAGDLQDAVRPASGGLPVLRYSAPQTFGTSGTLDGGGEILELVSLPRSFEAQGGSLRVELAPSLGAAMMGGLEALEHFPYECTEQTVSRFLPNLAAYRSLQGFGLDSPALQARLERTLDEGLGRLLSRQNEDGGWSWWQGGQSDPYVTAYALIGLVQARDGGVPVEAEVIRRAVEYLRGALALPQQLREAWQFDRLAFEHFALAQAGAGELAGAAGLYEYRDRLNPWAQALLALALEALSPGDERAQTLLAELKAAAIRSATGAHWEDRQPSWQNMSTPLFASAVALYALGRQDPASPLVAEALRYLTSQRGASGSWASTYETAWALMALSVVMQGTGELGGDFEFSATLNGAPLAAGQAGGEAQLNAVTASLPIVELRPQDPNALLIRRSEGPGRLYYSAHLQVNRPVESVAPLARGLSLARAYYPADEACDVEACEPLLRARAGQLVSVRLTLAVPESAYYLLVEDYIPAGAEVLDTSLETSQQGAVPQVDPRRPLREGWGWWYFQQAQVYDERIAWAADFLPAGTYELVYTLVVTHPGEFRVLPARSWQFYFPEVQGTSAGQVFVIDE